MLSVKLNYQTFPEYITEQKDNIYPTIQSTAPNTFLENNSKFIIYSLNLEDTFAPVIAIKSFDKYVQLF